MSFIDMAQQLRVQAEQLRVQAAHLLATEVPLAAVAALSHPIPLDPHGNIVDGPEQARRSCVAWYRQHGDESQDLLKCADASRCSSVDEFLQKAATVNTQRNGVAHVLPEDSWQAMVSRINSTLQRYPDILPEAGCQAAYDIFAARDQLAKVPILGPAGREGHL